MKSHDQAEGVRRCRIPSCMTCVAAARSASRAAPHKTQPSTPDPSRLTTQRVSRVSSQALSHAHTHSESPATRSALMRVHMRHGTLTYTPPHIPHQASPPTNYAPHVQSDLAVLTGGHRSPSKSANIPHSHHIPRHSPHTCHATLSEPAIHAEAVARCSHLNSTARLIPPRPSIEAEACVES